MKLYMFRTVRLFIIRSLFTVHPAMVYVIQVCRQLSSRTRMELQFHSGPIYKNVWHIPLLSVQWMNSWWWTEELSETCRFSCQNKFVKLVHLFGFITKKFVTMHGHTNVKFTVKFAEIFVTETIRMPLKFNSFQLTADFVWANDLSVIPLIGPRDILLTTFHLRQPCGKKHFWIPSEAWKKNCISDKRKLIRLFESMTSTLCTNWLETLYYITNYPLTVSVYSWPAHNTNTPNQGKTIKSIVLIKVIKLVHQINCCNKSYKISPSNQLL